MATDHWSGVASPHGVFVPTQQQEWGTRRREERFRDFSLASGQWLSLEGHEGGDPWT